MDNDIINSEKAREATFDNQTKKIKELIKEATQNCECSVCVSFVLQDNVRALLNGKGYQVSRVHSKITNSENQSVVLNLTLISWSDNSKQ